MIRFSSASTLELLVFLELFFSSFSFSPVISPGLRLASSRLCAPTGRLQLARRPHVVKAMSAGGGRDTEVAAGKHVIARQSHLVTFKGCDPTALAASQPASFLSSEPFTLEDGTSWQVVLYPGGTQTDSLWVPGGKNNSFMGSTYSRRGRTAVYLRYLPEATQEEEGVDCCFTLCILGRQTSGPRFDVAFDCGMRFCGENFADSSSGMANDWGAHVLPQERIGDFVDEEGVLSVMVNITNFGRVQLSQGDESNGGLVKKVGSLLMLYATAGASDGFRRRNGIFWEWPEDVRKSLRCGQVFVPSLGIGRADWRRRRDELFLKGVYPGLEYRIMGMEDAEDGTMIFSASSSKNPILKVRPIYAVRKDLDRSWPVRVSMGEIPVAVTQAMYNTATLIIVTMASLGLLMSGLIAREAISLYKIPSRSMEPTIMAGDLLVVEKMTARLGVPLKRNEIILFSPPEELERIVRSNGGRLRGGDLFVKRVAGLPHESFKVSGDGRVLLDGKSSESLLAERKNLCEPDKRTGEATSSRILPSV
uniref:Mitochondrial inner membrane protease subunit n=1 Tax=Guillardia theta TaxID=55529 RepID=A0A6U6AZS6_GUITH|mmetsp:Transcript_34348/g.107697  ORF Transcript_34348/g.107697 Transcript_34348/m.107697 type:complete len:534 (+) Transcript_34348:224-1825(+)